MDFEKKQLDAKISDCLRLCGKYCTPRFTCFFNEEEQAMIGNVASYDYNTAYFGGYDGAQRKMFGAFPEWQDVDYGEYPIKIIKLTKKYPKELNHRDYLGTIMSLGIERSKIGDILVDESGAVVFVCDNMADVVLGIEKIADCGVKTAEVKPEDIIVPEQEYDDMFVIAPSLRLDAIVAGVAKVSRNRALLLIKGGKVSLNHKMTEDASKAISVGDVLSLRGYGRYLLFSQDGRTGSGRLHVHIKKFR